MDLNRLRELQESLEVYGELDEGAAEDVAARASKLARERKGQTPQRKAMYSNLAYLADRRAHPEKFPKIDWRSGIDDDTRKRRVSSYADSDKVKIKTTDPKKLRKQKAMGEIGESYNIYDILISHLLDEGYAEDVKNAYCILENMSEDWVLEILGEAKWGKQPLPDRKMTDKAKKLGNKWLNTPELELGSPKSKKLLSRRSAILYQRDKNAIK